MSVGVVQLPRVAALTSVGSKVSLGLELNAEMKYITPTVLIGFHEFRNNLRIIVKVFVKFQGF